jgi:hypothetical protein
VNEFTVAPAVSPTYGNWNVVCTTPDGVSAPILCLVSREAADAIAGALSADDKLRNEQ